jgi:prepilin-type N-terminal cleavage/methylation domain-containing protein
MRGRRESAALFFKERSAMKRRAGFTLLEMLIVVAIIGVLASLLIPNALSAIQKAKQKGTMKDIHSIATALVDYVTDRGGAPVHTGQLTVSDALFTTLKGFYIKVVPLYDRWGSRMYVYGGSAVNSCWGSRITGAGSEDFVVGSIARDKVKANVSFNPVQPTTAYFNLTGMTSFNTDLVIWNGWWVSAPKSK